MATDPYTYQPLSEDEKTAYIDAAKARYAPTKQAFSDLINGKVASTDLDFTDLSNRLNQDATNSIEGSAQDLSNRGFLRSGEQVAHTVKFKEDAASNIQRADIQRQIQRANLLLQNLQFGTQLDTQAMGDANTDIGNELALRKGNADAASAADQRALQREMITAELQKAQMALEAARASGSGGGLDLSGLLGGSLPTAPDQTSPTTQPTATRDQVIKELQGEFAQGQEAWGGKDQDYMNRIQQALGVDAQTASAIFYQTRKPYELAGGPTATIAPAQSNFNVGVGSGIGYGTDSNGNTLYKDGTLVKNDPWNSAAHNK